MRVEVAWTRLVRPSKKCTPAVALFLNYRHQTRWQPFVLLDMEVDCESLRYTDSRIYWANATCAAAMSRFDYSKFIHNERSARFLVSTRWDLAKPLRIAVSVPKGQKHQYWQQLLKPLQNKALLSYKNNKQHYRKGKGRWRVSAVHVKEKDIVLGQYLGHLFESIVKQDLGDERVDAKLSIHSVEY
jgi:hypothetical protein